MIRWWDPEKKEYKIYKSKSDKDWNGESVQLVDRLIIAEEKARDLQEQLAEARSIARKYRDELVEIIRFENCNPCDLDEVQKVLDEHPLPWDRTTQQTTQENAGG